MARQTRAQRRARREAQSESLPQRAPARQLQVRPAPEPAKAQVAPREVPGSGIRRFVEESWGELKKVEWPGQRQVIQGTAVVLIACAIVGVFLYSADQVFKRVVEKILGQ